MEIGLRACRPEDFDFARALYFETMRWAIEPLLGWDQAHQEASFSGWFKPGEVSIVTADAIDAGWIQKRSDGDAIFLGSIYIMPAMQRKGIGTHVILSLFEQARQGGQAVSLAVMKINPALALYERLGFRITHEDEYKFYMRADPD